MASDGPTGHFLFRGWPVRYFGPRPGTVPRAGSQSARARGQLSGTQRSWLRVPQDTRGAAVFPRWLTWSTPAWIPTGDRVPVPLMGPTCVTASFPGLGNLCPLLRSPPADLVSQAESAQSEYLLSERRASEWAFRSQSSRRRPARPVDGAPDGVPGADTRGIPSDKDRVSFSHLSHCQLGGGAELRRSFCTRENRGLFQDTGFSLRERLLALGSELAGCRTVANPRGSFFGEPGELFKQGHACDPLSSKGRRVLCSRPWP